MHLEELRFVSSLNATLALLVGHETSTTLEFRCRLEQRGFRVITSGTLAEAIQIAATEAPRLHVIELKLPDGSGLDLLSIIKVNQPDSVVIVATAFGSIATAVRAIQWGAKDYLTKPLTGDHLLNAVDAPPCQCSSKGLPLRPRPPPHASELSLSQVGWEHMHRVLLDAGSLGKAAKRLGVDRRSLRRSLSKHPPRQS